MEVNSEVPSVYIGESSRSIQERMVEHWSGWRLNKKDNHMFKHQSLHHAGDRSVDFVARSRSRSVAHFKTALERQVAEAVRIRRRGGEGNILNSKAEYSRSRIPRLIVDQQTDTEIRQMEEEELWKKREQLEEELREWSQIKYYAREQELRDKETTK